MKFAWKQIAVAIWCMAMWLSLAAIGARAQTKGTAGSAEEARKFIEGAEQQLFDLAVKGSRASWVEENFITEDTEQIAANANEELNTAAAKFAKICERSASV
jgi:peptidyl-dipeptidase A